MGRTTVWPRLIWKEFRESILIALACAVLPFVGFHMRDWASQAVSNTSEAIAAILTPMAVFVWAAAKANTRRQRREFEATHLPLPAAAEWFASFLFPAIMAALIGANYGYSGSSLDNWKNVGLLTLAGSLCFLSGFAVCYVASSAFSIVPAIFVGMVWLIPVAVLDSMFKGHYREFAESSEFTQFMGLLAFLVRAVAGGVLGSVVFSVGYLKGSHRARQALGLLLALVLPVAPLLKHVSAFERQLYPYLASPISSPDRSLMVSPAGRWRRAVEMDLRYNDRRGSVSRVRRFAQPIQPIGFVGRGVVYLAQQPPGHEDIVILAWDVGDDRVREVARLPAGRRAMAYEFHRSCAVSPDGRYVLITARSKVGSGRDLWLVDTVNKKSAVVVPNTLFRYGEVRWLGKQAIVAGQGKAIKVELGAMKASTLDFLHPRGS